MRSEMIHGLLGSIAGSPALEVDDEDKAEPADGRADARLEAAARKPAVADAGARVEEKDEEAVSVVRLPRETLKAEEEQTSSISRDVLSLCY